VRRKRTKALYDYFQEWTIQRMQEEQKDEGDRNLPPSTPRR
jgi:hypothetical protein